MRPTKLGSIQDAVAKSYRAAGGVEAVADLLGIANSTASYGIEVNERRPGGLGVNYLARLAKVHPEAAIPLAEFFADHAGGIFQPVADSTSVSSLYAHCGMVAKECGEAQAATIKAAASADRNDIVDAEREIDEAIAALTRAKAEVRARRGSA